ncbi:hypothetical protein BDA96_06G266200 [Sorghum bicolor]|uniref:Uncharacterized protein n=1 Tax=Sorghum bicolor TaxID=4558 RepID=A0A921QTS8_SORBI|nr:hypothetical protein BDA96_06G266200 [Sorghum bicolor]
MGTPAAAASSTEFQPQCVMNHPTAGCRSVASCGAHPRTTIPRPASAARASNVSGTTPLLPALTTQTNGTALRSSASASAAATAGVSTAWLPNDTYTTEPSGNGSSHAPRLAAATAASPPRAPAASASGATGPTAQARLKPRSSSGCSRYLPSSALNELNTNPQLSCRFHRKFCLTNSRTCSSSSLPSAYHL